MKNDNNRPARARRLAGVCLGGMAGTLLAALPAQAETNFTPRVGVTATWVDNFQQVPPGLPKESELVIQATPGFDLQHDGQRFDIALGYELQALYVTGEDDADEVFHQARLGADLTAIPEWLFVEATGERTQSVVDPQRPANQDNMFGSRNLADTTSASVAPVLRHRFPFMLVEASHTRSFVRYDAADDVLDPLLDDSEGKGTQVFIGEDSNEERFTWALRYQNSQVEFDLAERMENDRAEAEIGVRVGRALRLLARGGRETDPQFHSSEGGFQETLWHAGFSWSRDERNELRVLVGERFFGSSYEAQWRRRGRLLSFEIGYNEDPTTESQRIARRPPPDLTGPILVPELGLELERLTSDVYLLKRAYGNFVLSGRVTRIALDIAAERREYILLQGIEDKSHGGAVTVSRQLGPRITLEFSAGYREVDLREGSRYDDRRFAVQLSRRFGARASGVLSANHTRRDSNDIDAYEINWIMAGVEMSF